jgi:hypothetical protein
MHNASRKSKGLINSIIGSIMILHSHISAGAQPKPEAIKPYTAGIYIGTGRLETNNEYFELGYRISEISRIAIGGNITHPNEWSYGVYELHSEANNTWSPFYQVGLTQYAMAKDVQGVLFSLGYRRDINKHGTVDLMLRYVGDITSGERHSETMLSLGGSMNFGSTSS